MSEPRVALVTGGAKRVGRAIVERLVNAGFAVAFTYHTSENEANEIARRTGALPIRADLTRPDEMCGHISDAFCYSFGELDVLVNNASLYLPSPLDRVDTTIARRMMSIHFESPMLLCRLFESRLRRSRGHVINMVDLLAERPWPQYLAYCASKAALWNLTLGLSRELAPEVTVNGVAPGVVEWPENYPETEKIKYLKRVPLGRAGTARDVAETVHFLATTGSYITGQMIRLDGGRSIT